MVDGSNLRTRLAELQSRLKPYINQRQREVAVIKKKNLISPEDTKDYGDSNYCGDIVKNLKGPPFSKKIKKADAISSRDHLMLVLCFGNFNILISFASF